MMPLLVTRWNLRLALLVSLLAAVGCGDGNPPVPVGIVVKGKIFKDGKPLDVPNREIGLGRVELRLVSTPPSGEMLSAIAKADGTFEFVGSGKGVPMGQYRLVVLQQDQGFQSDMLEGAFGEANSPIQVVVSPEQVGGVHDLGTIDLQTYLNKAAGS